MKVAVLKKLPQLPQFPFGTSIVLHLAFFLALMWPSGEEVVNQTIEIDVFVPPQEAKVLKPKTVIVPTQKSKAPNPKARPVFGVNKNSVSENAEAPTAKVGNTLSKTPDNLQLKPGEENLPAPADDFEVSEWPLLQNTLHIPYPAAAKQKNIEGDVIMDLYISETGEVKKSTLVSGPGYGLNEAALASARKFIFSPAKVNGKAVPVVIRYTYKFQIQR